MAFDLGHYCEFLVSAITRNFSGIKKAAFPVRGLQRLESTKSYKNPNEVKIIPHPLSEIIANTQNTQNFGKPITVRFG
jgi:hypothetical protein